MRVGLLQLNSGDDPIQNLETTLTLLRDAVADGAEFVLTPEVTNCVSTSRTHQREVLREEADDPSLKALADAARDHGIWLLIGSLALKIDDPHGRFANRSFLISPEGRIAARYDKIHMFDVAVSEAETYRESSGYRPGDQAVLARMGDVSLGMTVCYDLRFPQLYRDLAQAGAQIISIPSAFSPITGAAHWEVLLRARAIETGCFVLAPAQTGEHAISRGKPRRTYGHSLVVAPWGEVLADVGEDTGVTVVDLDLDQVTKARQRVPSLSHDRPYTGPK